MYWNVLPMYQIMNHIAIFCKLISCIRDQRKAPPKWSPACKWRIRSQKVAPHKGGNSSLHSSTSCTPQDAQSLHYGAEVIALASFCGLKLKSLRAPIAQSRFLMKSRPGERANHIKLLIWILLIPFGLKKCAILCSLQYGVFFVVIAALLLPCCCLLLLLLLLVAVCSVAPKRSVRKSVSKPRQVQ